MAERVAVVTGGSRGIGKSICVALAKNGFNIVTCYTSNPASVEETLAACKEQGVEAYAVCANVANSEDVDKLFDEVKDKFGRIDVLVNNAGITRDNLILRMTEEEFNQVIDVNLKGAFLCSKVAAKMMLKKKYGRIINISSVVGISGNAGQVNYSSSKAGLLGMTKSIAKELGGKGITANAIAPGFIQTEMTEQLSDDAQKYWQERIPRKRLGKPEDIANAVCFLASENADYITGVVLPVDGGMTC
ncbi:MAG: 3-oxoacyl-[acyl-carrier-protein] reductase [Agathobacter sp.]|nr:3-oxoacyl-[acyl-carrier-protein] reductase [Agathobacter sp.]MEE1100545.1 3-oxoacyl-[acyl-carrier-protein] reductase [Agathobacter sp.]